MRLEDLYGQPIAQRQLRQSLARGRISHAYLFSGPPGTGKKTAALAWAQALNCPRRTGDDACDQCPTCRGIQSGVHPDLILVRPQEASIRLEQVREIRRRITYGPCQARYLVVILVQAENLTLEAANALLKSLEEPSSRSVFVVVSDRPEEIPATVRSRCQTISFRPIPRKLVAEFLRQKGVSQEDAEWLATVSGGSLSRAEELAMQPAKRNWLLELWYRVWRESGLEVLRLAKEAAAADGSEVVTAFTTWLRDLWVWARTGQKEWLRDPKAVENLPAGVSGAEIKRLRRTLAAAWAGLERSVQEQLLWEVLFLQWPRTDGEERRTRGGKGSRRSV